MVRKRFFRCEEFKETINVWFLTDLCSSKITNIFIRLETLSINLEFASIQKTSLEFVSLSMLLVIANIRQLCSVNLRNDILTLSKF